MSKPLDVAALEELYGVTLPERLRRFFESGEHREHEGKRVGHLPNFSSDTALSISFAHEQLPEAHAYFVEAMGVDPRRWLPLGALGDFESGTRFMAADLGDPQLPVYLFDYEEGPQPHSHSFEAFLAGLLGESEATPAEALKAACEEAVRALEAADVARYGAVAGQLGAALERVAASPPDAFDPFFSYFGGGYHLLGKLHLGLGDRARAIVDFEAALTHRSYRAGLSLLDLYLEGGERARLIERGEQLRRYVVRMLDEHVWYHVRRYLGRGYIELGDEPKAVLAYHEIREAFASDPARLGKTVDDLQRLAQEPGSSAELATRVLRWFAPKQQEPSPRALERLQAAWATIPPKVQRAVIRATKVEAAPPSPLELGRMLQLDRLDLRSLKLDDLSFLGAFTELRHVELGKNRLRSLGSLPALPMLESLELGENHLESLEGVERAPRLTHLDVAENKLTSLAGVERLERLRALRANENQIADLAPLAGLSELREVTIFDNQIGDLSPLGACPMLEKLSCFSNPLERGLEALAELPWLESWEEAADEVPGEELERFLARRRAAGLPTGEPPGDVQARELRAWWASLDEVWKKPFARTIEEVDGAPTLESLTEVARETSIRLAKKGLTELAPIQRFDQATGVNIAGNQIEDLSPLAALPRLRELSAEDNLITSLEPLRGCRHLEELDVARNRLRSLSGVEALEGLVELCLKGNEVEDLGPLTGKTRLESLYAGQNRIRSLEPLRRLPRLRALRIEGNRVTDLSPLADCPELRVLICFANPGLTGLMQLVDLPRLRRVHSHCGVADAELARFAAARPDVDLT